MLPKALKSCPKCKNLPNGHTAAQRYTLLTAVKNIGIIPSQDEMYGTIYIFFFLSAQAAHTIHFATFSTAQIYIRRSPFNSLRVTLFNFFESLSSSHSHPPHISPMRGYLQTMELSLSLSLISKFCVSPTLSFSLSTHRFNQQTYEVSKCVHRQLIKRPSLPSSLRSLPSF